jgi:hypothetical protein
MPIKSEKRRRNVLNSKQLTPWRGFEPTTFCSKCGETLKSSPNFQGCQILQTKIGKIYQIGHKNDKWQ